MHYNIGTKIICVIILKLAFISLSRKFDRKDWTTILIAPRPLVNKMNLIELAKNINADNFIAEVMWVTIIVLYTTKATQTTHKKQTTQKTQTT